jgi:hypothetical protein
MALARCILGKFLGVVCHCFPLLLIQSTKNLLVDFGVLKCRDLRIDLGKPTIESFATFRCEHKKCILVSSKGLLGDHRNSQTFIVFSFELFSDADEARGQCLPKNGIYVQLSLGFVVPTVFRCH